MPEIYIVFSSDCDGVNLSAWSSRGEAEEEILRARSARRAGSDPLDIEVLELDPVREAPALVSMMARWAWGTDVTLVWHCYCPTRQPVARRDRTWCHIDEDGVVGEPCPTSYGAPGAEGPER